MIVSPIPLANPLQELIGCDDNNDGISEYFDTLNIESIVLGNQTGMMVTYYDAFGNLLPSPLPNPYTNTINNQEIITVRVTNTSTECYTETPLILRTASQPQINKPLNKYACDEGDGFSNFDMSGIEAEIIGNQLGLSIMYFDTEGNQLPSALPNSFQNTQAWSQKVLIRVENEINSLCYSETDFDLIVNELPTVDIEDAYFLCDLEPSLTLNINNNFNNYHWEFEDGSLVSNTHEVNLINAGNYKLIISKFQNGIYCENSFDFELIRSTLPVITDVNHNGLSDNNFIEIITIGDGDFEYSIDGIHYQDNNYFDNVQGGTYTVYVRDKEGCGEDSEEITIVDYPKFFTPNNDGSNDYWQIKGINRFPNSKISIYDRYGKLLTELSSNDYGWDGKYNGMYMPTNDYWFSAILNDEINFSGHFTLKR